MLPGLELIEADAVESKRALTKVRLGAGAPAPAVKSAVAQLQAGEGLISFPERQLRFGVVESELRQIGLDRGAPWDVDLMADAFRKGLRDINRRRSLDDWKKVWGDFCSSYAKKRRG